MKNRNANVKLSLSRKLRLLATANRRTLIFLVSVVVIFTLSVLPIYEQSLSTVNEQNFGYLILLGVITLIVLIITLLILIIED